jgi:hypothetical protein
VISTTEYDRIHASLNAKQTAEQNRQKKEQENGRLRELSRKQVNTWGNTLSGQRVAKLEAKKIREAEEEEVRKQEDIEEAIFHATQRKKAIAHAKTLTFAQTDRVKGFHGALILTEVLKEREKQVEMKGIMQRVQAEREKRLYQESVDRLLVLEEDEKKAAKERSQKRKNVQKYQLAQVKHRADLNAEELAEQIHEGEESKRMKDEHIKNEKLKQQALEEQKKYTRQCYLEHLQGKEMFKQKSKIQEAEELTEIKIFNEHKERMTKIRAEKAKEKISKGHKLQARLLEQLENEINQKVIDEDKKIRAAQIKLEAAVDEAHRRKQERVTSEIRDIKDSLTRQKQELVQLEKERKECERREKQADMEADYQHCHREQIKARLRRETNMTFQDHHLREINRRVARDREEHELDLACDQSINKQNRLEEEQFQSYAKGIIDKAITKERNPFPLRKAAEAGAGGGRGPKFSGIGGLKPSYMACDETGVQMPNYCQRKSTLHLKNKFNPVGNKGKKRLGLIW